MTGERQHLHDTLQIVQPLNKLLSSTLAKWNEWNIESKFCRTKKWMRVVSCTYN